MKTLMIGLILLTSISSFANDDKTDYCTLAEKLNKSLETEIKSADITSGARTTLNLALKEARETEYSIPAISCIQDYAKLGRLYL